MILSLNELEAYHGQFAMVDGCFDPLHIGHVRYFEVAAKLGVELFCNVQGDQYINRAKKRPGLLPEEQRVALVDSLKTVSYTHLCKTSTEDILLRLRPAKYIKGLDWKARGLPQRQQEICKEFGIEIVYLDTMIDSSTNIVGNFLEGVRKMSANAAMNVNDFENYIYSQKELSGEKYDQQYFEGEWRADNNSYSIEVRREKEAKNPQNIKDIFNPKSVLDVGCGPGALMLFLSELGLDVHGIDFSEDAKKQAPEQVRDRIKIGQVTEHYDLGKEFDLVICREVLEHLTVLQVRKTVAALAKYTTKYLYVTTRYHPNPKSLLDVTTDFETDPTHITAMNKEFLKVLFLLEGLRSRPDLEAKLDWKGYGRVMVFERPQA